MLKPVNAVRAWLATAKITEGPTFRPTRWRNGPAWGFGFAAEWSSPRMMVSLTELDFRPLHASSRDDHGLLCWDRRVFGSIERLRRRRRRKVIREAKVVSEPEALIGWFAALGLDLARIGLEAGPLSQWLYAAMKQAGLAVELLETRHVRVALQTMPVKTDRNDARGIAQLMRLGWFRPVHCKSVAAQETRALLTARKLVQSKLYDIEMSLRGILRGFGLKVGPTTSKRFARRIEELVAGHATLEVIAKALLSAHAALLREFGMFEKRVRAMARQDKRARLRMSARPASARSWRELRCRDRRSVAVFVLEAGRATLRPDTEKISVR